MEALTVTDDLSAVALNRRGDERWLREMCGLVGVAAPADAEECLALARETVAYVIPRVSAAFPEVVESIRALARVGYELHMASNLSSFDLGGYLQGMEVRHLFSRHLYGPDLVNTPKRGPLYYQRIFADAGVPASRAVVVDDSPRVLSWAPEAGAHTILVSRNAEAQADFPVVRSLDQLPAVLSRIGDSR